jgi:predicted ATPase
MKVIVTGGPGAGKTALLNALQARGHTIVGDSARSIIQRRRASGLSPRPNPLEFANAVLQMDVESFVCHAATRGRVFFERGIPDALGALNAVAPLRDNELRTWLSKYPYCPNVFVLPPWQAIYVNDAERDHTFEHAEWVYHVTRKWYRRLGGYRLIDVPKVSVEERCTYVLDALASAAAQPKS